jgi:hypothetical protein
MNAVLRLPRVKALSNWATRQVPIGRAGILRANLALKVGDVGPIHSAPRQPSRCLAHNASICDHSITKPRIAPDRRPEVLLQSDSDTTAQTARAQKFQLLLSTPVPLTRQLV